MDFIYVRLARRMPGPFLRAQKAKAVSECQGEVLRKKEVAGWLFVHAEQIKLVN